MRAKPDILRLLELQQLLQQLSQVERVVHRKHSNKHVNENDTEHSYNLAMTAWYISPHFPELDRDLMLRLALAHDMIEVHAGDTYIYGSPEQLASKKTREADALVQLQKDWPDFTELTEAIEMYEAREVPEAKFIYALDKIMPIMLIYINDGHTWKLEDISLEKLHDNKREKIAISPDIEPYYLQLYALLKESPHLIKPR